jgi:hypothetical protein
LTEEEARRLIRELGWTPYLVKKGEHLYLAASRKIPGTRRNLSRHLAPLPRLATVQPDDIKKKLAP